MSYRPRGTNHLSTTSGPHVLFLLLALASPARPTPIPPPIVAEADSLLPPGPALIVRSIQLQRENVFRPDEPETGRFYARLANALHRVTAARVIRRGLYFAEGDTLRGPELEASLRRLRAYPFLRPNASAEASVAADSIDVRIRTQDDWSTLPEITYGRQGRLLNWTAGLHEENLGGLGKDLLVMIGQTDGEAFWSGGYGDYQLLGSPVTLLGTVTHGPDIDAADGWLERPLDRAAVPWALRGEAHRFLGRVVDHRGGLHGPEYCDNLRRFSLAAGPRVGGGDSWGFWLAPALHLTEARYVPAADRDGWRGGGAGLGEGGPAERLRERNVRALGLAAGILQERYTVWSCVETLRSWEDVNLGAYLWMMAGASTRRLGAARDALYWSLEGRRGLALGPDRYALLALSGSGLVARGRVSDGRLGAALRCYQRLTARQSLALRISGNATRDLAPQDLPTMGAESGLRGFDAYRFWGERIAQANLEDRVLLVVNAMGLVSVGVVGFVDGGVAWQGDGRRAGRTRVCAGGGLRVQGTRTGGNLVTRIDVGRPIAGGEPGDGWVVSIGTGQAF
jgi:hypothetical protein